MPRASSSPIKGPKSPKIRDESKLLKDFRGVHPKLLTPLMRQYIQLKNKYRDAILLFRVGDFYETYFEDAITFSEAAEIILTRRPLPNGYEIPMAGVPYHSVDNYIKALIDRGYKVAIAEQLEDPKKAKGLVKRDIVQVITSGTVIEPSYLDSKTYNFLAAVKRDRDRYHLILVDFSSRRAFYSWFAQLEDLIQALNTYKPSEILVYPSGNLMESLMSYLSSWEEGERLSLVKRSSTDLPKPLRDYLETPEALYKLGEYGGEEVLALAINYLLELNPGLDVKLSLQIEEPGKYLRLDPATLRNLEVLEVPGRGVYGSLLWALDNCVTPMGSRLLRLWLLKPLADLDEIRYRYQVLELLTERPELISQIRDGLRGVGDLDRLTSKVRYRRAKLEDIYSISLSLRNLMSLVRGLSSAGELSGGLGDLLAQLKSYLEEVEDLVDLLERSLEMREDGTVDFRRGFDPLLDEYRDLIEGGQQWLEEYQEAERKRTGIKSLKIGYNQVFGYYIEVTKANLHLVPPRYERKQTLTSAERFTTPELKEFEVKYLSAQEQYQVRVEELREHLSNALKERNHLVDLISSKVAELDLLSNFASLALERGYVKPELTDSGELRLQGVRHPSLELIKDNFVPNDISLTPERRFMILTGPNMGGKSTFLKTIGLAVIMAHIGSFVPADRAIIGLVDGIYSRMGASDDILRGRSTFMTEMLEMAYILNNATSKSLLLLDEIGRGTSTYDGLALAWAITEYIAKRIRARGIFATHFYQLTTLQGKIQGIFNAHVQVSEESSDGKSKLVFLYKVKDGALLKSYGIEVARLAGIREEVIKRAYQLLKELEVTQIPRTLQLGLFSVATARGSGSRSVEEVKGKLESQEIRLALDLLKELRKLNLDSLRPIDALNLLYAWKEKVIK